jgi:hypothetical protein
MNSIASVRRADRLDRRIKREGASCRPRKTNDDIIVELLKAYLAEVEAEHT